MYVCTYVYVMGMSCPSWPQTASLGCDALNENSLSMWGILPKHELLVNDFRIASTCSRCYARKSGSWQLWRWSQNVPWDGWDVILLELQFTSAETHHFEGLQSQPIFFVARPLLFRTPSTPALGSLEPQGFCGQVKSWVSNAFHPVPKKQMMIPILW